MISIILEFYTGEPWSILSFTSGFFHTRDVSEIHAVARVHSMVLSPAELNFSIWIHHKVSTHQFMDNWVASGFYQLRNSLNEVFVGLTALITESLHRVLKSSSLSPLTLPPFQICFGYSDSVCFQWILE